MMTGIRDKARGLMYDDYEDEYDNEPKKEKEILLPYNSNLIENINLDKKEIIYKNIEGLI